LNFSRTHELSEISLFQSQSAEIIFGAHQITTQEPTQQRQTVYRAGFRIHPLFTVPHRLNDIAILRTTDVIQFNAWVQPIIIACRECGDGDFVGETATISGWGSTTEDAPAMSPHLRSVQNIVITNAVCFNSFPGLVFGTSICMASTGGRGGCFGDTGGPLTVARSSGPLLIGVFSFSQGCGRAPNVFVRVTRYESVKLFIGYCGNLFLTFDVSFTEWIRETSFP
jgi:chymotrypsin